MRLFLLFPLLLLSACGLDYGNCLKTEKRFYPEQSGVDMMPIVTPGPNGTMITSYMYIPYTHPAHTENVCVKFQYPKGDGPKSK